MQKQEWKQLERFFKDAPTLFIPAVKNVLNSFAFGTKKELEGEIDRNLTVRARGFVKSSIRVAMAKGSNMANVYSETYTRKKNNFSGWIEQERGSRTNLDRQITKFARGGSYSGRLRKQYRLGTDFFNPERYSGRSYEHKVTKMIGAMRTGYGIKKQPFILKRRASGKYSGLPRGVYGWQGKRIKKLQDFDKHTQPQRIKLMDNARRRYFSSVNIIDVWSKSIQHILSRMTR